MNMNPSKYIIKAFLRENTVLRKSVEQVDWKYYIWIASCKSKV